MFRLLTAALFVVSLRLRLLEEKSGHEGHERDIGHEYLLE